MTPPPQQPSVEITLEQQIFDVRLQLDKAQQNIHNNRPVDLEGILVRIKALTDDLVTKLPEMPNEKRIEVLENLKTITGEVNAVETALIKNAPRNTQSNIPPTNEDKQS